MSLRVGTTSRAITSYGGAELLRETARAVGLDDAVGQCLHLKARSRGLSESEFVASMAESIALGARCLDDLAVTRADAAQTMVRGHGIPAPQTAGAWLRRFTLGHIGQLNKALEIVQRNALGASKATEVTLDFDSTYVFSRSTRRQGVDRTYKRGYALHPLLCFEASSGVAVHARLRRGKAGPSSGIGTFVRETLRRVPEGVTVRSRLDSGFYSGALFSQLERAGVTYLCGVPLIPILLEIVTKIGPESWARCLDKDEGEVGEFGYRMRHGRAPFRRYIVKRIALDEGQQLSFDGGAYRYWIFVTNDHERSAVALESEHRHKADVESGMRELKSNFGLHAFRKHGFMANWAWLLLICLGHNLCCWTQQLGHLGPDETVGIYAPSDCAIGTWLSRPWWCAAGGASRCAFTPPIHTWSSSQPRSTASRSSGLLQPDPEPVCRRVNLDLARPHAGSPSRAGLRTRLCETTEPLLVRLLSLHSVEQDANGVSVLLPVDLSS